MVTGANCFESNPKAMLTSSRSVHTHHCYAISFIATEKERERESERRDYEDDIATRLIEDGDARHCSNHGDEHTYPVTHIRSLNFVACLSIQGSFSRQDFVMQNASMTLSAIIKFSCVESNQFCRLC